jgi:ribosomal small subunit protein bTHX
MGKGDKKTKRGKIIIGSSGVKRSRKKKSSMTAPVAKAEPKPKKEVEEIVVPVAKAAPKKSAKKAVEHEEGADLKPKATKTKKKVATDEAEPVAVEPKQD